MTAGPVSLRALPVAPQADADMDTRLLRAWLAADDDGEPVMVLTDGDTTVVLDCGIGVEHLTAAVDAAGQLADVAAAFRDAMRTVQAERRAAVTGPIGRQRQWIDNGKEV